MPGPPKQSNQHKQAKGSKKIHSGEDITPDLVSRVPDIPEFLKGKHYAVIEWRRVCKLLIEESILTTWDYPTIKIMCAEYQRYRDACADMDRCMKFLDCYFENGKCKKKCNEFVPNGEYIMLKTGYEQVRPSSTIRNKAFAHYEKLLQRIGADVVSRSKMKRVKPQEVSKNKFGEI